MEQVQISRRQFLAGSLAISGIAIAGGLVPSFSHASEGGLTFTPGTYEAAANGQHGKVAVSVTFSDHSIDNITVTENGDTQYISRYAVELVPSDILRYQSLDVDAASGATMTSMAILSAVQDCFDQANAQVEGDFGKPEAEQLVGEDRECDVLVVGSGPAGVMAALAAASADGTAGTESGLSVIVAEQLPFCGGSLIVSGAGIFSIYGDPQHESGEFDTIEEDSFVRYLTERSENDPLGCLDEGLQRICYRSIYPAETLMIDSGAPFSNQEMHVVDAMALQGEGYSDNAFANLAFLDAEGNVIAENSGSIADIVGEGFVGILGSNSAVETLVSTEVVSLIVQDGDVVGAQVVTRDQDANTETTYAIHAKKVILATGAPNLNYDFLVEQGFDLIDAIPFSEAGSTGVAPRLLEEAGFAPVIIGEGGMCYNGTGTEFGMEDGTALGAAGFSFVNKQGLRYFDEGGTAPFDTGRKTVSQQDNTGYAIVDSQESFLTGTEPMYWNGNDGKRLVDYAVERGWAVQADSLEEIAEAIGVPKEVFLATVEKFNSAAAGEIDDEMGSDPATMLPVTQPPFFAITVHAVRTEPYIGLKCMSGSTQIASGDNAVPNVHGCGTLVGPNLFYHNYFQYCGGLTMALAMGYAAGSEVRDAILSGK